MRRLLMVLGQVWLEFVWHMIVGMLRLKRSERLPLWECLRAVFTDTRKVHWPSWQHNTCPSSEDGLDIRSLSDVFEAFSMKLWWRFQTCTSLWTRFMRDKYCTSRIQRQIQPKLHDSQTWKWMLASCPVTKQHIRWRIRRGELFF
ncbi:Uncharacterized protein TCM_017949 [Theobroma cacao]|uniref:Reverse transcriptase zinc-binding domain-containing protein n=1 Tax=Theobroma cacao TaxID=3641 RepID=A0A061EF61_THECC|nr:Uncharacterized protein TCM_017949 [Theobroma cacao]